MILYCYFVFLIQFFCHQISITPFPCPFLAKPHPCLSYFFTFVLAFWDRSIINKVMNKTEKGHGNGVHVLGTSISFSTLT